MYGTCRELINAFTLTWQKTVGLSFSHPYMGFHHKEGSSQVDPPYQGVVNLEIEWICLIFFPFCSVILRWVRSGRSTLPNLVGLTQETKLE